MQQWFYRSIDGSDPLVLEYSQADRIKKRDIFKIGDYPQVIQDMIFEDHPYNPIYE